MKNNLYLIFIISLILAFFATNFSVLKGSKYLFYSLLEVVVLLPIGMLVIYGILNGFDRLFPKKQ